MLARYLGSKNCNISSEDICSNMEVPARAVSLASYAEVAAAIGTNSSEPKSRPRPKRPQVAGKNRGFFHIDESREGGNIRVDTDYYRYAVWYVRTLGKVSLLREQCFSIMNIPEAINTLIRRE